jgi:hypothetical protein
MTLYHYCCDHSVAKVTRRGFLYPQHQPLLGAIALVWLTDMDRPDRDGLGLTSNILQCDRMDYRYICDRDYVEPWAVFAERKGISPLVRIGLEEGRMPERWFVSERNVFAQLDRRYANPFPLRTAEGLTEVL